MKCTLKAECSKNKFLQHTFLSIECKESNGFTYGFYYSKSSALEDCSSLLRIGGVKSQILKGWEVDGFFILKNFYKKIRL